MARVLMVSKPIAPPWNDSSKNLVRDLASHMKRHAPTVMVQRGSEPSLPGVAREEVYAQGAAGFAPALFDNARVMARLLVGPRHDLWHFFFAPNPRTSAAGRIATHARRTRAVQTVCSAPRPGADLRALLFAERTVVLSRHTEQLVLEAGLPRTAVRRIAPAVGALAPLPAEDARRVRVELGLPLDRPLVVYPGDLEFSSGAERTLRAHAALPAELGAWLAIACRAKTPHARVEEQRLRALARELGVERSVTFLGETRRIHGLLAAADVVALPAETLYAKMDLPLVLIEAMLLGRPVVVAEGTPAAELCEGEAALSVGADPEALPALLARVLGDDAERARLGERARQAARSRYDPAAVASAYKDLYDELLR
jgi:glycosyltransferase involved in cell wall biosynthesis